MDIGSTGHKIQRAINGGKRFLLVVHRQPDADALGSLAAVGEWLERLGKSYVAFCREVRPGSANPSFLIDRNDLLTDASALQREVFDAVIVLDSGDLGHAGLDDLLPRFVSQPTIINIDHHATNHGFGSLNLVDPAAASTTPILYRLFHGLEVPLSPTIATALLAGIIFDTTSFTNPNTTKAALEIAAQLLLAGARLPSINELLLRNKTVDTLRLWGTALARLQPHPAWGITTTVITAADVAGLKDPGEATSGIANFLNNLEGATVVLVLQQEAGGKIKGSLRTNSHLIDLAKLATMLGGGGHKNAAGFTIEGTLIQTTEGQWQVV